jgi:hypothetical protein
VNANFGQKSNVKQEKQEIAKPKVKDKSGRGPQVVPPHTAIDSPPGKRKKPVMEKTGKLPGPANFPGEITGVKKSLSSFKIPKRKVESTKAATSPTTTTTNVAVKIPALGITEEKVTGAAVVGKTAGTSGREPKEEVVEDVGKVMTGSVISGNKEVTESKISDLHAADTSKASITKVKELKKNLPSNPAPSVLGASRAPVLKPAAVQHSTMSAGPQASAQTEKAKVTSQGSIQTLTAMLGKIATSTPASSSPIKEAKAAVAKGSTVGKKTKEPPKSTPKAADSSNKLVSLFQTLDPSVLQSLAITIQQSLTVSSGRVHDSTAIESVGIDK